MDFTIEGKLYNNGTFEQGCIGVEQGKIVAIKKAIKSDKHINVGNNLILPTGIDLHVHFRDPGFTHKEDFATGSLAAAFGGISCVVDMPNNHPQITSKQSIKEKTRIALKKSFIDFGLYAAINNENIGQIAELSPLCIGFKIFLGDSTNLIDHLRCRDAECEAIAIRSIIHNSQNLTSPIHICHLSSYEGFEALQKRPDNISVGVTPHHLFFDVYKLSTKQTFYKVNPPIRSHFDQDKLWFGVTHNLIDIFESDHAPHTIAEKENDFNEAPSGLPGVETMYPLLLVAIKKGQLALPTLLRMLCERPAQLIKIPKGKIQVGLDADFIVVDMKKTELITADNLHSKCGWTPFEGYQAIFPSSVFLRGEKIIENRQILVNQGFGIPVGE
jgi:dihydroorotase